MFDFSLRPLTVSLVRNSLAACAAALVTASLPCASLAAESSSFVQNQQAAIAAFGQLKKLEGAWRVVDRNDHPLRIRIYPTAGGNTLVESWEVNSRSHSLTVYHLDGDTLLATHYCPQANQPRMELAAGDDGKISFVFRDVTDFDPATEQHQHDLTFELTYPDRILRSEHYADGDGTLHPSQLVLERVTE